MVRIYLEKTGRKPALPLAPLIVGALWFGLVLAGIVLASRYHTPVELCLFKRLTGIPCPTCGSTTGGMFILQGHFLRGWLANPFVYTAVPLIGIHLLFQIVTGYSIRYRFTGPARIVPVLFLTAAIIGNWTYLLVQHFTAV